MSGKKTIIIGDDMIENRLKEKSIKLGISVDELIDRYIRRGLYSDDYYESPQLTMEELLEMSKKDVKKDMENGIPPKKHNFNSFVGKFNRYD